MKKFAISIIAGIAMLSGIACGGGSSWSDADKAQLAQSKTLAISLGVLTDDQAECYSDWLQSNYDSMAEATADESDTEAQTALSKACNIDASVTSDEDEAPTTTTTTGKKDLTSFCQDALSKINVRLENSSLIVDAVHESGRSGYGETVNTIISTIDDSLRSVELCATTNPELTQFRGPLNEARTELVNLGY